MERDNQTNKKILLAGSSHTRMLYLYAKDFLRGDAVVSKLPHDAGNTAEILGTIRYWPLEDIDVVHVYAGHRDLMPDATGRPFIDQKQFKNNLEKIAMTLLGRTRGKIIFSTIPPVADSFLTIDPERNHQIVLYNKIINRVASGAEVAVHDFYGFVVAYPKSEDIYADGLHFTRQFYRVFAAELAGFLRLFL